MHVIIMGPPGAGKGTQAKRMQANFGLVPVSTGDMFRQEIASGSALGEDLRAYLDAGLLVPDDLVMKILLQRMAQPDCQSGVLFDGFPRTITQAQHLQSMATIDAVVIISVPDSVIMQRMTGRRVHHSSGRVYHVDHCPPRSPGIDDVTGEELEIRSDDRSETVAQRLAIYHSQTAPLIDWYRAKCLDNTVDSPILLEVDGDQAVEVVEKTWLMGLRQLV